MNRRRKYSKKRTVLNPVIPLSEARNVNVTLRTNVSSHWEQSTSRCFKILTLSQKVLYKIGQGTVSVSSRDPPNKDSNARFTTVPLKFCLIK